METSLPPMPSGQAQGDKPLCLLAEGLAGLPGQTQPAAEPAVLVGQGRILALGRQALDSGARRQALPGLWLAPAPLDAHVHLHLGGTLESNLEASLAAGLAAVRDLGHRPQLPIPRTRPGQAPPWVIASGPGLGSEGPGRSCLAQGLAGPEQFSQAAWQRALDQCGVVKVFASGLLDFDNPGQVLHSPALTAEELAAAVRAAEESGLSVAAHASGAQAVRLCLEAGVRSIEHGFFLERPLLREMAARRVSWLPTCAAVRAHAQDPEGRHTPEERQRLASILKGQMQALRLAEGLGVDLVLGSDAGSYGLEHGVALFEEMACWLEAGVRPQTVFAAATSRAARLLGLAGQVGSLEKGAVAWLLGVPGDPQADPLLLAQPRWRSF
ncbi:MAG: amidohydrolase family protein [Desulfarculus sp.]|nr:amidohydrolase family protein [Desulfarculus sp.]